MIISRPALHLSLSLQARELYGSVCELQPLASQGWLEWAKMEEECGQVKFSLKILREGPHATLDINTDYSYMRKLVYDCHFFYLIIFFHLTGMAFQLLCLCRSPRIALRPSASVNRIVTAYIYVN